ncbi:protein Btn2p [Monosporozyma unispora]|nr:hypothetical protein C6P44_004250 [Kazachstania unispora]
MYSQLYNPCLFQQLPVFHDSVLRPAVSPCPMKQNVAAASNNVKMTTTKNNNGLTLTFTKPLIKNSYQKAIEYQFYELKQSKQPTYKIVTDFFGNEYYVANQVSEQEILNQIDVAAIGRKLAKESFQDYSLELSHDGSKILISSPRDNIDEPLQFGSTISDFHVAGCGVINDNTAILKIDVTFDSLQSLEAKYQKLEQEEEKRRLTAIKKAQKNAEAKQERLVQAEEARRAAVEQERLARVVEAKKMAIEQEKQRRAAIAASELKAKQEHAFKKQLEEKKRREREIKLRQQYEHQQKFRRENEAKIRLQQKQAQEKLRKAYEDKVREEQSKQEQEAKRQRQLQEQIEYQKRLVEEENQSKEKKRKESLLAAKKNESTDNDVVNIRIHFDKDDVVDNHEYNSSSVESSSEYEEEDESHPLRRYSSPPVLEDVEDDEMNRYNESLNKSPKGFSIIEDA